MAGSWVRVYGAMKHLGSILYCVSNSCPMFIVEFGFESLV